MAKPHPKPCEHRAPGYRKHRPLCRSCGKRASITPEYVRLAVANLVRGRRKHLAHLTEDQAREYRWLTNNKNIPAADALRIISAA